MTKRIAAVALVLLLGAIVAIEAQEMIAREPTGVLVLGCSTFWRYHYQLMPAVMEKGGKIEDIRFPGGGKWLHFETPSAPAGWTKPDFDDSGWLRMPADDPSSPWIARVAMRGKFAVSDPAAVKGLALSLVYKGGVIVTLNGEEIARGHLPKGEITAKTFSEAYAVNAIKDAKAVQRTLDDIELPSRLLRKGVNVLGFELVRSAYRPDDVRRDGRNVVIDSGLCGLVYVKLTAPTDKGLIPNVTRPKGFQVWNSDVAAADFDVDFGDPNEALQPVRIVGARGGTFSGKVVAGSTEPMKSLKGVASDLAQRDGTGKIPAGSIRVRYALPDSSEANAASRYTVMPTRFDGLEELAPAEVPIFDKQNNRRLNRDLTIGPKPVPGAVQPIWVTVDVPRDAQPGDYAGTLTISLDGVAPFKVPVELKVSPWTLPEPKDYSTLVELVESPESVALRYGLSYWSNEHMARVARSLEHLHRVGNFSTYIPLICDTNQGNDESMVRWIRQADGSYKFDFTVMEGYLDLVEKHQGRPKVICLYVWDTYLDGGRGGAAQYARNEVNAERNAHEGKGPIVSFLNEGTGKVEKSALPVYADAKSESLWKPLVDETIRRLKRRGYEKEIMFGVSTDNIPTKPIVDLFAKIAPGVPWVNHAHPFRHSLHGTRVGYSSGVWGGGKFPDDPSVKRTYGWKRNDLGVHHPRSVRDFFCETTWRFMGEMNVAGEQRGFARLGADFWSVFKDSRGNLRGSLSARFPKTTWRNLDINTCLLAPGANGPISTARYEMIVEGVQACEARIAVERALTDEKLRAKMGDETAERIQRLLDDRVRDMRRAVSTLQQAGVWTQHAPTDNTWWQAPPVIGTQWFVMSGWQDKLALLYDAAAEVEKKLGK